MYQVYHPAPGDSIQPSLLSFNTRPNPVEPQSTFKGQIIQHEQGFPSSSSNAELRRVLHKSAATTAAAQGKPADGNIAKRRKLDDGKTFDLPKLPVRAAQEKRPRLPPTLSGLYQPPPDAGLLPSISVEQPKQQASAHVDVEDGKKAAAPAATTTSTTTTTSKLKTVRKKWSDLETEQLLRGVARFGIGCWTKILRCPDYDFGTRSALDLKDRFRVCCPDQYGGCKASKESVTAPPDIEPRSEKLDADDLERLGITVPFQKSRRRQRHGYSEAEDEQLLKGFQKYGKSWSSIQQDATFDLGHRTRTDLKDRMRTRYPDIYNAPDPETKSSSFEKSTGIVASIAAQKSPVNNQQVRGMIDVVARQPAINTSMALFAADPYLSEAFEYADFEAQAITLDRGILDWASTQSTVEGRPSKPAWDTMDNVAAMQITGRSVTVNAAGFLPSLATITAPSGHYLSDDRSMHELPALSQFFAPSLDVDDRPGPHAFLSLDELLS